MTVFAGIDWAAMGQAILAATMVVGYVLCMAETARRVNRHQ